ncbi:unnamed protein product [Closterium sp. NIES-54]
MIEGEYIERSHSGQSRVARDEQSSAQSKAGWCTARAATGVAHSRGGCRGGQWLGGAGSKRAASGLPEGGEPAARGGERAARGGKRAVTGVAQKYWESQIPAVSAPPGGDYQTNMPRVIRFEGYFIGALGPIIGHFYNIMWQQQQQRTRDIPPPQQLREWYAARQRGGGTGPCTYVLRTGDRTAIFDLDFDAILAAMYAVTISDEGDCYRCFPPDPGIETAALGVGEAAALGASEAASLGASTSASSGTGESALSGTASASASRTFTLDSGASRSFFRDCTTLTPLGRPVAVSLADPSGGPVLAHFSTVLPCPAAPSSTLSGLYLPSFSTNLVSGADLQDAGVHQFTPASQRVTHCTDARIGRHLATFTRRPGSSLYTLTTASPPVTASGQVAASGQVLAAASRSGPESAPCSCRLLSHETLLLLSHETLLWHHRLGHPSLHRL